MEASAKGAGLVYLCNPNNPTATVLSARAIAGVCGPRRSGLAADDGARRRGVPRIRGRSIVRDVHSDCDRAQECRRVPNVFEDPRAGRPALRLRDRAWRDDRADGALQAGVEREPAGDRRRACRARRQGSIERERALNRTAREFTRQLFATLGFAVGAVGDQFRPGRSPARLPGVPGRLPARWRRGGALRFRR